MLTMLSTNIQNLIYECVGNTNQVVARNPSAWDKRQKVGEFVNQLRRNRQYASLNVIDATTVEGLLSPDKWEDVGVLKGDLRAPELIALEQEVGKLIGFVRAAEQLSKDSDVVFSRINKLQEEAP